MVGFGDVGKSAARILLAKKIEVVAVDVEEKGVEGIYFVRGDARSEEFWQNFNLDEFNSAILALPSDTDAILVTMILKKLKPDLIIVARCNNPEYVEKLYRAGADYVFDLPSVTSEVVVSTVLREFAAKRLFYEGYLISKYRVLENARIVGRKPEEFKDVVILGIEKDGKVLDKVDKILPGMCVIAAGKKEKILEFEKLFIPSKQ